MTDYYVGLMSGTSMDGIDAVLIEDHQGFRTVGHFSKPYRQETSSLLESSITTGQLSLQKLLLTDQRIAEDFAQCALDLLDQTDARIRAQVRAIGMHGQTVFHAPEIRQTLQLGNPNHVATALGIPVVADVRRADLCAGGQGAPLAPAFHNQAFRSSAQNRIILNLGGIANITLLPAAMDASATGCDTGPASTLMDIWVRRHLNQGFDDRGTWARSGQCHQALLASMLKDPYFQARPPKSTGREYFHLEWLQAHLGHHPDISPVDVQATLCELTVRSIADAIASGGGKEYAVYVCGGGWNNHYLIERLQAHLNNDELVSTASLGIDPQLVEGAAFAWIARQHLHGLPASLPAVTGAERPMILGALYPGNAGQVRISASEAGTSAQK